MNEAIHYLRAKIYTALNGNVSLNGDNVPVYNRVPTLASHPYIWIYSLSTNDVDINQDDYIIECITRIECVTRFDSDVGGDLDANLLVNSVVSLLVKKNNFFDLSANDFSVYTSKLESVNYVQEDESDHTYFRGIVEISNRVQKTS